MSRQTHTKQKLLGAYYTPRTIADRLTSWALRAPTDRVLDPSFGGCVFLESAIDRLSALGNETAPRSVWGIDIDDEAVRMSGSNQDASNCNLLSADFFDIDPGDVPAFEAVVGNPPFVRFQLSGPSGARGCEIAEEAGVSLSRMSSLWAPFIVHAARFLSGGGRMAQVLPAELLHAQYARPVLDYLTSNFRTVTVLRFRERIFPGAQTEVVLLFADGYRDGTADGVGLAEARSLDVVNLENLSTLVRGFIDPSVGLLTLLPERTRRLYGRLRDLPDVLELGQLARVRIGVVTGANDFFLRTQNDIQDRGLAPELFQDVLARAADLLGVQVTPADIAALGEQGRATKILMADPNWSTDEAISSLTGLIAEGERRSLNQRRKCRVRSPWWAVPPPTSGSPDLFLTYMSGERPRMAFNAAGVVSTNTIHNLSIARGVSARALAVAFTNSLTLLSAELVGRSYGGGLLKLEPTEAERLLVPKFPGSISRRLAWVDRKLRAGDLGAVLERNDAELLAPLGVTSSDIASLRRARLDLLQRRKLRTSDCVPAGA